MVNKINWGVLGASGIAIDQVIPAIQQSRLGQVVALGSRDVNKATKAARDCGIERVHGSYESVLADQAVDVVYIPLPNSLHVEWIVKAAEAGKHVLCEKPIAMTASEAEIAVAASARYGVKLMEGFMYRFHPQTRRVQELLAAGTIGKVKEVRAHLSVDIMSMPDPHNVRFQPALGGGSLYDMGCYAVNAARMVFNAEPKRAFVHFEMDQKFNVDRNAHGILEFDDGTAFISSGFDANGQGFYSITGTKGVIDVPRGLLPGLGTRAAEALIVIIDADGYRTEEHLAPVNQYGLMADAFCEAIIGDKEPLLPPKDSINNMNVLDALFRSAKSQTFEPVARQV